MPAQHLVVADCVEGSFAIALGTRIAHVVQHWRIPAGTPVTPALADAVFAPTVTLWSSSLGTQCSTDTTLGGFAMRDLRTAGMALVSSTLGGAAGTSAGERLPNQIALCLTMRTARAGKAFRGRNYWPGLSEAASQAGGILTAGAHTSALAFCNGYLAAVNRNGLQLAVMHRPLFGIDGSITVPGSIENATAIVLRDDVLDTQRRRVQ